MAGLYLDGKGCQGSVHEPLAVHGILLLLVGGEGRWKWHKGCRHATRWLAHLDCLLECFLLGSGIDTVVSATLPLKVVALHLYSIHSSSSSAISLSFRLWAVFLPWINLSDLSPQPVFLWGFRFGRVTTSFSFSSVGIWFHCEVYYMRFRGKSRGQFSLYFC